MNLQDKIRGKIEDALPGAEVKIKDASSQHVEHNPTGAHILLKVQWEGFKGKTMVEQHQTIYKILGEELKQEIHALRIQTSDS